MVRKSISLTKEEFESALGKELEGIKTEITILRAGKGRLKSNPLLKLYDEGKLSKAFILFEMPKLQNKTSSLPSGERNVLCRIIDTAIRKAAMQKAEAMQKAKEELDKQMEASQ